jgi:hypothetical protein
LPYHAVVNRVSGVCVLCNCYVSVLYISILCYVSLMCWFCAVCVVQLTLVFIQDVERLCCNLVFISCSALNIVLCASMFNRSELSRGLRHEPFSPGRMLVFVLFVFR